MISCLQPWAHILFVVNDANFQLGPEVLLELQLNPRLQRLIPLEEMVASEDALYGITFPMSSLIP